MVADAVFMMAAWTTVLTCQVEGLSSLSDLVEGPQSHLARRMRCQIDMSDEDKLRNVVFG